MPVRRDVKAVLKNQLNTSALNTASAFGPYQDLTTRDAVEQQNILFEEFEEFYQIKSFTNTTSQTDSSRT